MQIAGTVLVVFATQTAVLLAINLALIGHVFRVVREIAMVALRKGGRGGARAPIEYARRNGAHRMERPSDCHAALNYCERLLAFDSRERCVPGPRVSFIARASHATAPRST